MKKILFFLLWSICVQSCVMHSSKVQQQLLSYVQDYRQQIYPDIDKSDSLFYLILFFQDEGKAGILINANNVEIPGVVRAPLDEGNAEYRDPFFGYTEIENNFLFFYCSDCNREFVERFVEGLNVKKDIDENTRLSKYHTSECYIDSESWKFYIEDDCLLKIVREIEVDDDNF